MPEVEPVERVVDRREPGDDAQAPLELRPELGQREVRAELDQLAQLGFVRLEQPPAMAAKARRRGAAGCSHPLHQLDRGRRADRKAPRRLTDRAAALDRAHDPHPQIQRHRCRHGHISAVSTDIVESQAPIPRNRNML